jgi:hypothetical protein
MTCSYRVHGSGFLLQEGSGETVELSSRLVKFKPCENVTMAATDIDVSIPWPAELGDGTKLQVVFKGKPIWEGSTFLGMSITRHEFRTRGVQKRENAPVRIDSAALAAESSQRAGMREWRSPAFRVLTPGLRPLAQRAVAAK